MNNLSYSIKLHETKRKPRRSKESFHHKNVGLVRSVYRGPIYDLTRCELFGIGRFDPDQRIIQGFRRVTLPRSVVQLSSVGVCRTQGYFGISRDADALKS